MTNREKLEELREQLGTEMAMSVPKGTMPLFRVLRELIGLLLGADGPRSPIAEADRADKLVLARDHVAAARALMEPKTEAGVVGQALSAIAILADVLAAEPAPRRAPRAELRPGDVVRLRSGGPTMMALADVAEPTLDGSGSKIACSWFKDGDVHAASFPPAALVRIVDEQRAAQRERERRALLADAARVLNDTRAAIASPRLVPEATAKDIHEQLADVRDRIAAALAEDV